MSTVDLVATWQIKLADGLHKVEFEHGTTTGKRVIRVDEKEILRHNYLFKLVGNENFSINGVPCKIIVDTASSMKYQYKLDVNGQTYERYQETTARTYKIWNMPLNGTTWQITLDTQTLDVRVNGELQETLSEFTDYGSELCFQTCNHQFVMKVSTANYDRQGLSAVIIVDNNDFIHKPES